MDGERSKLVLLVGARPQFVKLKPVCSALDEIGVPYTVVHSGQHYDFELSRSFFEQLELPEPDANLEVRENGPERQAAAVMSSLGGLMSEWGTELLVVFGDTSTTVGGALAARFRHVTLAHVEAGMRSRIDTMPEEISRVVTDRIAQLWFAPSKSAATNLAAEGLGPVDLVGDVMYDLALTVRPLVDGEKDWISRWGLRRGEYVLATVHRAENTGDRESLDRVTRILREAGCPVLLPLHPRTDAALREAGLRSRLDHENLRVTEPLPYVQTLAAARFARHVVTDSGGLQKEAFYMGTPCTTLREATEWPELVDLGWNRLVGLDPEQALASMARPDRPETSERPYGNGDAAEKVARRLLEVLSEGR